MKVKVQHTGGVIFFNSQLYKNDTILHINPEDFDESRMVALEEELPKAKEVVQPELTQRDRLESMTKDDLLEYAKENGLSLNARDRKDEIIDQIEAAIDGAR